SRVSSASSSVAFCGAVLRMSAILPPVNVPSSPIGSPPVPVSLPQGLALVRERIVTCEQGPRLRQYCQRIAREKKRAHRADTYWGRPVPGFGAPAARLLIVGLAPAAHGANRTGRVFTGDGAGASGDFLMGALHCAGFGSIRPSQRVAGGRR